MISSCVVWFEVLCLLLCLCLCDLCWFSVFRCLCCCVFVLCCDDVACVCSVFAAFLMLMCLELSGVDVIVVVVVLCCCSVFV